MKNFNYTIKDPCGIHVRAASTIVKEAEKYKSIITLHNEAKKAMATKMLSLLRMNIKCGDEIQVDIIGADETDAFLGMKSVFERFL